MNNITKEFVEEINKKIAKKAESIQRTVYQDYDNSLIAKTISQYIDDIRELLEIRTKLLK